MILYDYGDIQANVIDQMSLVTFPLVMTLSRLRLPTMTGGMPRDFSSLVMAPMESRWTRELSVSLSLLPMSPVICTLVML